MTHIIIGAAITRHDDAPVGILQGEKGRWVERHDDGCRISPFSPEASFMWMDQPAKTGKKEPPHRSRHSEHLSIAQDIAVLLLSGSL